VIPPVAPVEVERIDNVVRPIGELDDLKAEKPRLEAARTKLLT
jgi:hypothetical protein